MNRLDATEWPLYTGGQPPTHPGSPMPTFLSDPSTALYVVLAVAVLVTGVLLAKRQKRSDLINFSIPAAALLAVFVIDQMFESPRETVARKLREMEAASQARKYDDLFKHVSDKFEYKSHDKKWLRDKASQAESYFPEGVSIWDIKRGGDYFKQEGDTIEQEFAVQPKNHPEGRHQCVAVFKKESDGEWRMVTFRLYPVVSGGEGRQEVTPPGL
jgi:hypothetical protein